jgi:3D (Asp-Asp-Asp) domain-containing protein
VPTALARRASPRRRIAPIPIAPVRSGSIRSEGLRIAAIAALLLPAACAAGPEHSLDVAASAYTSTPDQTSEQPFLAAWGDSLEPGMRAIAVSRDLLELGLVRGTRVRIDGLPGEYVVLDKMAKRWRKKIDIYMGEDIEAARRWGVRDVRIRWRPARPLRP